MTKDIKALKDNLDHTAMIVREHRESLLQDKFDQRITSIHQKAMPHLLIPMGLYFGKGNITFFIFFKIQGQVKNLIIGDTFLLICCIGIILLTCYKGCTVEVATSMKRVFPQCAITK